MIEPPEGLGLTGAQRMARLESGLTRLTEMVGDLGNKVDRMLEREQALARRLDAHDRHHTKWEHDHDKHVDAHDRRHRGLDFRWYGVVAGMVAAAIYLIAQGGGPPVSGI